MSVNDALEKLALYRSKKTRKSEETFTKGIFVLNSGASAKLGHQEWDFLEQLALASLDMGRTDVADQCLRKLGDKFPGSPRVDVLTGIRMEATEPPATALDYYDELLKAEPTNVAVWKRRISVLRRLGSIDKAVEELNQLLDTFYTDLEGWLELADLYSTCNQYTHALQALSHALLLAPQNPLVFLQFAETAYTSGDVPLAFKMFLVVIDMNDIDDDLSTPGGISTRAWWGVKLCARQLLSSSPSLHSPSATPIPANVNLIDELATERLLKAYSGETGARTRNLVSNWMSNTIAAAA